jgi:hypothetical protein
MIIIPIPKDIVKHILSEYLWYDDITELQKYISDIHLNQKRLKIKRGLEKNGTRIDEYIVDKIKQHTKEYWHISGKILEERNYDYYGKLHGLQIFYNRVFGKKEIKYYVHGILK